MRTPVLACAVVLAAVACGPRGPWGHARPVTGPDGSKSWAVVECRIRSTCLELAGETCPHAYEIREDDGKRGRTTMLIHCVSARAASSTPAPAPTPAPAAPPTPGEGTLGTRTFPE